MNVRDVVSPDVILVTPASGAGSVEPNVQIVVRFSEAVDRSSVTHGSIRLTTNGAAVPFTIAFADGDQAVTLTPVNPLKLNTNYTIDASTQIRDVNGNALFASRTSVFKTKSPDTVPPRVVAIAPANNAVNVPVGTDVRVSFTEPVDRTSITPASFRVTIGGLQMPGQFNFLDDDATVRFGPDAPLPFDAVVIVELTSGITDRFENPLVDSAGQSLVTPLTFTFLTGSFGITSPTNGSEVLESSALLLEAKATSSLNIATITFTVNGQALPAIAGPPFATTFNVGLASATPTLTIVATGRNASGAQVAQDQVVVTVVPGLRAAPRLLGVPLGTTRQLRLGLPSPLTTDLVIQLAVVDSAIATLSVPSIVLPAGQTEVTVPVTGVSTGATTITATSARGTTWAVASVSPAFTKTIGVDGSPVGIAVVPARLLGQVVTPVNGQTSIVVPILGAPAIVATAVDVTSSNPAVASVNGAVVIAAGSRTANIVITTGVQGTATLTFRVGGEISQLTIVVGNAVAGVIAPTLAQPVGVVVIPSATAGRVFAAPTGQSTFRVTLLSEPAATPTLVTVTSSDANVARVNGAITLAAGEQSAEITVITGAAGTATLTFHIGSITRQLTIFVGTPPPEVVPPTVAKPVGIVLLAAPSAGRLFTPLAGQAVLTLQLVSSPVAAVTPVTVTSSDPGIAAVFDPVTIAAGARVANVRIVTGAQGTATLTFHAGGEGRQLTIVVGTPAPGTEPPVIASPVGVVLIEERKLGSVFTGAGGHPNLNVTALSAAATSPTVVTVSSSNPNIASVEEPVVVPAGSRIAAIKILPGIDGVATLTLRAGNDVAQILVVVGPPPALLLPLITAPIVGVEKK